MTGEQDTTECTDDAEGTGPLRLCIVTRTHKPLDDLIRFVLAPDGAIVPDLARRLPGRGVWVGATHAEVAAAARQKLFARSLKRPVTIPANLADLVQGLLRKRLSEAISLANKAGLVVAGFFKVDELIGAGRAALLIHARDGAADGIDKLDRKFKALHADATVQDLIVQELDSAELSLAMGRSNVIHAAASAGGASQRIAQQARFLKRYRASGG